MMYASDPNGSDHSCYSMTSSSSSVHSATVSIYYCPFHMNVSCFEFFLDYIGIEKVHSPHK